MLKTKIVFLHIPKTAGQSVHHFLQSVVGASEVAPTRVNEQLRFMSIDDIRAHQVISGHFDWCLLDCIEGPKFVFTILRNPVERILSFYFYLRKSASMLSDAQLALPQNQGMNAALKLSCDEYFRGGSRAVRNFLDDHYENFYTYYFAGRSFDCRQRWKMQQRHNPELTDRRIVDIACANLATLDGVYSLGELARLQQDIERVCGPLPNMKPLENTRINTNTEDNVDARLSKLEAMGATPATFDRIEEMTELDNVIWSRFCKERVAPTLAARASTVNDHSLITHAM